MIGRKGILTAFSATAVIAALAASSAQARPTGLGPGGTPLPVQTTVPVATQPSGGNGFDWTAAGIGAAVALGVGGAGVAGANIRTHHTHHPAMT